MGNVCTRCCQEEALKLSKANQLNLNDLYVPVSKAQNIKHNRKTHYRETFLQQQKENEKKPKKHVTSSSKVIKKDYYKEYYDSLNYKKEKEISLGTKDYNGNQINQVYVDISELSTIGGTNNDMNWENIKTKSKCADIQSSTTMAELNGLIGNNENNLSNNNETSNVEIQRNGLTEKDNENLAIINEVNITGTLGNNSSVNNQLGINDEQYNSTYENQKGNQNNDDDLLSFKQKSIILEEDEAIIKREYTNDKLNNLEDKKSEITDTKIQEDKKYSNKSTTDITNKTSSELTIIPEQSEKNVSMNVVAIKEKENNDITETIIREEIITETLLGAKKSKKIKYQTRATEYAREKEDNRKMRNTALLNPTFAKLSDQVLEEKEIDSIKKSNRRTVVNTKDSEKMLDEIAKINKNKEKEKGLKCKKNYICIINYNKIKFNYSYNRL
jgi:hypothetical protein